MIRKGSLLLFAFVLLGAIVLYLFIPRGNQTTSPVETDTADIKAVADIEIIEFRYWVSVETDLWWRYAYRIEVLNNSDKDIAVRTVVKYLDSDGEVVDSTRTNAFSISPGEKNTVSGHSLISVPSAQDVTDAEIVFVENNY